MSSRFNTRTVVEAGMMLALAALLGRIILFHAPMGGKVTAGSMIPLLLIAMLRGPLVGIIVGAVYGIINFLIGGHPPVSIIQWLLDYPLAYAALGVAGFFWLPAVRKFVEGDSDKQHRTASTLDLILPVLVLAVAILIMTLKSGGYFAGGVSLSEACRAANIIRSLEYGGIIALLFTVNWNLMRRLSRATYFLPVAGAVVGIGLRLFIHFLSGVWFFGQYAPEGTPAWLYSLTYNAQFMLPEIIISGFILVYLAPTVMRFLRQRA